MNSKALRIFFRLAAALGFGACVFFFLHLKVFCFLNLKIGEYADRIVVSPVEGTFVWSSLKHDMQNKDFGVVYSLACPKYGSSLNFDAGQVDKNQNSFFLQVYDLLSMCRFTDRVTYGYIDDLIRKGLMPIENGSLVFFPFDVSTLNNYECGLDFFKDWLLKQLTVDTGAINEVIEEIKENAHVRIDDKLSEFLIKEYAYQRYTENIKVGDVIVTKHQKIGLREQALFDFLRSKSFFSVLWTFRPWLITLLLSLAVISLGYFFLRFFFTDIFFDHRKLAVLATVCIISLVGVKVLEILFASGSWDLIKSVPYPIVLPFSSILIGIFLGVPVSAFICTCLLLIYTLGADVWNNTAFNAINILSVGFSFLMIHKIRRLNSVFRVLIKLCLTTLVVTTVIRIFNGNWSVHACCSDTVFNLIGSFITSILVVGLIPLFDVFCGSSSTNSLLVFLDPEQEFLKKLFTEAPGTYQHSVLVGCMAEAAADAIGKDGLLCRVAGQYHDIGKLINPSFFIENRSLTSTENITSISKVDLVRDLSIILSHIAEGVNFGHKIHLPKQVIKIIEEHHGTTIVHSLYHRYINSDRNNEGMTLEESAFRYKGGKPSSVEATIIMLADCFEAASRSMEVVTETSLEELLDKIVVQKFADGQFEKSPLSLLELNLCKQAMLKTLAGVVHLRNKYPESSFTKNLLVHEKTISVND